MTENITCPVCGTGFESKEWIDGECPNCDNSYYWEEVYTDDNYWSEIHWDDWGLHECKPAKVELPRKVLVIGPDRPSVSREVTLKVASWPGPGTGEFSKGVDDMSGIGVKELIRAYALVVKAQAIHVRIEGMKVANGQYDPGGGPYREDCFMDCERELDAIAEEIGRMTEESVSNEKAGK